MNTGNCRVVLAWCSPRVGYSATSFGHSSAWAAAASSSARTVNVTFRSRLWEPAEWIVEDLNRFLRGWAGYFRYGNSARVLGQIRNYALVRLASWLSRKGNRRRAWGWGIKQVLLSPDHLGLISLDRTVRPPRPFRDWRRNTERRR
jgi:hypothetical protein